MFPATVCLIAGAELSVVQGSQFGGSRTKTRNETNAEGQRGNYIQIFLNTLNKYQIYKYRISPATKKRTN